MASTVLYPAIVNSTMPAFDVLPVGDIRRLNGNYCRIYFSLSKFNSTSDFSSVQVSIRKQSTGENVVNTQDNSENHLYRATGIILDFNYSVSDLNENEYYIDIYDENLKTTLGNYSGWLPGDLYQVQLRLSEVNYQGSELGQAAWLNEHANDFSEWSTICIVKAISEHYITSSSLKINGTPYDSSDESSLSATYSLKSSELYMIHNRTTDDKEDLYLYKISLYDNNNELLEESEVLYSNQYQNNDEIKYVIKYDLQNNTNYILKVYYGTRNDFTKELTIYILAEIDNSELTPLKIYNVENDNGYLTGSSESLESEDGMVLLYITKDPDSTYSSASVAGDYVLRRASSKENFTIWEDIYEITVIGTTVSKYYQDLTIESGVFYKYAIQKKISAEERGELKKTTNPSIREFDYSYLLGENGQQLRLMFDNTMNSFSFNIDEAVQKTFGNFPVVQRTGAATYRTFPINGLISFNMDENKMFLTKMDIYKYQTIIDLYEARESTCSSQQYNFTYERDFRMKVLSFLQDGKRKLFKSPTEGNVMVRVTGVSCTPNQQLSRLIYSFSSTGTEVGEATTENLTKFKIMGKLIDDVETTQGHTTHAPLSST